MKPVPSFLRPVVRTFLLALLAAGPLAAPSLAADIILEPGYISGEILLDGASVTSASLMADGGGYTSSRALSQGPYTVTVQGGDWTYQVWTSASAAPPAGAPETGIAFPVRSLVVPVGATVANDYHYPAAFLRFILVNTGDPLPSWQADSGAQMTDPAESGPTAFSLSTSSAAMTQDRWDMVVLPSSDLSVQAALTLPTGAVVPFSFTGLSLAAGEVLEIPLEIAYVAPPPPPEDPPGGDPPPPPGTTGTIQGQFELVGATDFLSATIDYGAAPYRLDINPGSYRFEGLATPADYTFRVSNSFGDGRSSLTWPMGWFSNGGVVTLAAGETATFDLVMPSGVLTGAFLITGTLTNRDLSSCDIFIEGSSVAPLEGGGLGPSLTAGGSAARILRGPTGVESTYRLTLTPGPWSLYKLVLSRYALVEGAWSNFSYTLFDYTSTFDGVTYLGTPDQIVGGQTLVHDREYSFGTVALRFVDSTGGAMSQPQVRGSATILDESGNLLHSATVAALSEAVGVVGPVVEIHGVPGTYTLDCSATLADGSFVTFPPLEVTIVASVKQGKDLLGPDLSVTSPAADTVANQFSIPVTGLAWDESGLAGVTVNGEPASLTPEPVAGKPGQVAFLYEFPLADGVNTLRTEASDILGNMAYDERRVLVDRSPPTVTVTVGTGSPSALPVEVTASDLGFGFSLAVRFDGVPIWEGNGPSDLSAPATLTWNGTVNVTAEGGHEVAAVVTDLAGNTVLYAQPLVGGDQWPPAVSLSSPRDGVVLSASGTFAIAASASDQGNGFTLTVSVDGAPLSTVPGPADATAPATIAWAGTAGPLPGGEHLVTARVTDLKGQTAVATRRVRVDSWAPLAAISFPANGATFQPGAYVSAYANASDRGWGFSLTLRLDGVLQGTVNGPANALNPASTGISRYFSSLGPGTHTLEAVATDLAGNVSRATSTFTVLSPLTPDTWFPSVTLTQPQAGLILSGSGVIPITATASDRGNGFTLEVAADGGLLHSEVGPADDGAVRSVTWSGAAGPLPPGEHEIRASVTDLAGHAASTARMVRVDGWAPMAAISFPSPGATFAQGTEVPVSARAADQGWGFTFVLSLDGAVQASTDGPGNPVAPASVDLARSLVGLSPGSHTLDAAATDLAGNTHRTSLAFVVVPPPPVPPAPPQVVRAEVVVQPPSANAGSNGLVTVFVKLPVGLTRSASLVLADTAEITASPPQNPLSVSYDRGTDRLIFKFRRTRALLSDTSFTFRGLVRATPAGPWSVWEGSDTIDKLPPAPVVTLSLPPSTSTAVSRFPGALLRYFLGR